MTAEQGQPRPRRPAPGRLWVLAGDKRQKLQEQVASTNRVRVHLKVFFHKICDGYCVFRICRFEEIIVLVQTYPAAYIPSC